MSKRRVVITGVGAVTPIGLNTDALWQGICASANGVGPITRFDHTEFAVHFASEVTDFDPTTYMSSKAARHMDRFSLYAVAAAQQAVDDCGLDIERVDKSRFGCIWASGIGGLEEIESTHKTLLERGPRRVNPFFIPKLMLNAASGQIAIRFGIQGVNFAVASACASGAHAICCAHRSIQNNESDVVITGGSEASITALGVGGFCALRALSERNDDPLTASRPFNKDRDGFVIGEGAGGLILEEYDSARRRGAKIYAEVLGVGMTDDGYHISAPLADGAQAVKAMENALRDGAVNPDQVEYVNAHGTSTALNDVMETRAIHTVFGNHARKLHVSSTKSQIGHLLGASGAVEAVVMVKAIEHQIATPTINYINPDPECDLDYVPNEARDTKINFGISNSFGFGGHNVTVLFGKVAG